MLMSSMRVCISRIFLYRNKTALRQRKGRRNPAGLTCGVLLALGDVSVRATRAQQAWENQASGGFSRIPGDGPMPGDGP